MRWPLLGNSLVTKIPVVLELTLIEVFKNTLLLFCGLLHPLIEFILGRMLYLLAFVLDRLGVPGIVHTSTPARLP